MRQILLDLCPAAELDPRHLDRELFTSILEAQVALGDLLVECNTERPRGALRQLTRSEFAPRFAAAGSASLHLPQQGESNEKALT